MTQIRSLALKLTFDPLVCLKSCSLERDRNGKKSLRDSLQFVFVFMRLVLNFSRWFFASLKFLKGAIY